MKGYLNIAAAAVLMGTSVQASPGDSSFEQADDTVVKVGIIDQIGTENRTKFDNVEVVYKSFTPTQADKGSQVSHGDLVISSISDQASKMPANVRVVVYSAGIIDGPVGKGTMSADGMKKAFDWFKENDVKFVNLSFVAPDSKALKSNIDYAENLGLVIVAPTPNASKEERKYPAAYDNVISVTGIAPELPSANGEMTWAKIGIQGDVEIDVEGKTKREFGSSYGSARIAFLLALKNNQTPLNFDSSLFFLKKSSRDMVVARINRMGTSRSVRMDVFSTARMTQLAMN